MISTAEQQELFGEAIAVHRSTTCPAGYADHPGTGPAGETCGSCAYLARITYSRTYRKCYLMRAAWTHGPGTDILVRSPACSKWEPIEEGAQQLELVAPK